MLPEGHIIQQATSLAEMATITDKGRIFSAPVDKKLHSFMKIS